MTTVADVIIDELRLAGVRAIFGVPGGVGNLDLIAAAARAGMPFVLTSTETAGAIAAIAQAEVTGAPGACLTTLGPGAASAVNGAACAFLERVPVLVFCDSHAAADFEHQRLDHAALFQPITNASVILSATVARTQIRKALAHAKGPRPGPVHVDCPGAVCSTESSEAERSGDSLVTASGAGHSERFAGTQRPQKPLVLAGLGARRVEDVSAIRELCDRLRIPAMVTYKAKGVVPDNHPWFAGVFTNGAIEQPLVEEADWLIGVGLDPVELLPRPWKYKQPIVHAGPWRVEESQVPFQAQITGGVPECLAQIETQLVRSTWDADRVRAFVTAQRDAIAIPASGLTAHRVVELAAARCASTCRVTVDAGAHMFPATMLWPVGSPNDMLISNGLSTMGFAVPAAIGAALAEPSKPVVALTGDGGLLMCAGELLTAARERARVTIIVFNDASLSLIEIKQEARRLPASGVALGAVDWRSLGGSVGIPSFAASNEHEFSQSLDSAMACDGPSLIDVKIDRSNYGATLRAIRG